MTAFLLRCPFSNGLHRTPYLTLVASLFVASSLSSPRSPLALVGSVDLFSGATGDLIFSVSGTEPFGEFGASFDAVGDVNLDGHADFVTSDPRFNGASGTRTEIVFVLSGVDDAVLWSVEGAPSAKLGQVVAGLGDLDFDGIEDVAALGPRGGPQSSIGRPGAVFVCSGRDGNVIRTWG